MERRRHPPKLSLRYLGYLTVFYGSLALVGAALTFVVLTVGYGVPGWPLMLIGFLFGMVSSTALGYALRRRAKIPPTPKTPWTDPPAAHLTA